MKRIGILTFHNACNYGAFLQAYSLQNYLEDFSETKIDILDYSNKKIENSYTWKGLLFRNGNIVLNGLVLALRFKAIQRRNKVFSEFRKKYFSLSQRVVTADELQNVEPVYDKFIVGSDQVWNPFITDRDEVYYLNFVNDRSKRNSYAASVELSELDSAEKKRFQLNVLQFANISVREEESARFIKEVSGQAKVHVHVDPVFLNDATFWRRFEQYTPRKKYVLFFLKSSGDDMQLTAEFAQKLACENGCDVLYLSDQEVWYKYRGLTHFGVANPAEFIGLIDHAEFVVTNSFHATAFSILLHKEFYVEISIRRSGRIMNLLALYGLEQCALEKGKPVKPALQVDWNKVDQKISLEVEESRKYLENVIEC